MTSTVSLFGLAKCYKIEALIREVQYRPAIWNKNCDGYMDRRLKTHMWEEVYESLIDDWKKLRALEKHKISCEVQKKWKNVKDSFKKELHLERKIAAGLTERKKKRYVHYDALSFLSTAELNTESNVSLDGSDEESDNASDQENTSRSSRKRKVTENPDEQDIIIQVKREQFNSDEEENNSDLKKEDPDNNDNSLKVKLERSAFVEEDTVSHKKLQSRASSPESNVEMPGVVWVNEGNCRHAFVDPTDNDSIVITRPYVKAYNEDVSFTEMIIPMLRKLTDDQKHFAKIEIMKILHKAKFLNSALIPLTKWKTLNRPK